MQFFLATLRLYQDIWRIGGDHGKVTRYNNPPLTVLKLHNLVLFTKL